MSMVFDGLVLRTSMDFDGRSWISMVDHQIPCSPWSFMVTISPGIPCLDVIYQEQGTNLKIRNSMKNSKLFCSGYLENFKVFQ